MFNRKRSVKNAFDTIENHINKLQLSEQEKRRLQNLLLNIKTYSIIN